MFISKKDIDIFFKHLKPTLPSHISHNTYRTSVPLSPFNNSLVELAEWVGDTGLVVVIGGEILYTVSLRSLTSFS